MGTPLQKVLYISYDGMTDPLGQSQVLPYLIGLSKEGYKFTILSCEKPDRYEKYKDAVNTLCASSTITWIPLMYTKWPPVLSTILDILKLRRNANDIYREEPYQMVHARGHYITSLVALALKRKYNIRYIFDMRGFWADERVDGNLWNQGNPLFRSIYHFFKRKEKEFFENADHVITLTHVAEAEIHSWKNIANNPVPITVIPCCADMNTFSLSNVNPEKQAKVRNDNGLSPDDYVLLYLGSLGTWYMLDEMLDFFKVLLSRKQNAKFLFVTNDAKENIIPIARKKGIDKASLIITNSPFAQVPVYISIADSSVFFIKPSYSKKGSSPIKQGELMSMGVPAVCNANVGDTDSIIRRYNSGVVVNGFTTASYDEAVEELLHNKFDTSEIIKGARSYFSVEEGIKKYLQVYKKVLKDNTKAFS